MFRATSEILFDTERMRTLPLVLKNAVEESAVLHTRQLCDTFLSTPGEPDDIRLSQLFPGLEIDPNYTGLRQRIKALKSRYGSHRTVGSIRWTFNKLLAHATTHRGVSYDYAPHLCELRSIIEKVTAEIEALRNSTFGEFP